MGKRGFNRVSPNLPVSYYWNGDEYEGVVKDLSGNGMYIESETCPGSGSNIKIALIVGDEELDVSGTVKRTEHVNGSGGMGIMLIDPSLDYRRFVCIVHDYTYNGPSLQVPAFAREKVVN